MNTQTQNIIKCLESTAKSIREESPEGLCGTAMLLEMAARKIEELEQKLES